MSRLSATAVAALLACALPFTALAQDTGGGGSSPGGGAAASGPSKGDGKSSRGRRGGGGRTSIDPYIEASQVVTAESGPGDDILTYTSVAAGVEAEVYGVNNAASLSLRYERRFGWSKQADDGDVISGIARGYTQVAPGIRVDAGALATRSRVSDGGTSVIGPLRSDDDVTQIYAVYAGPSVSTYAGDVALSASYRFGYTKVEEVDGFVSAPGAQAIDIFDESTVHVAEVHAGVKPYDFLPVGLGVGANYYREDITNLDQRAEEFRARADVTYPVSPSLALVAGVGYEDVQISSRDAVRDSDGNPLVGPNGRYVTDKSDPRVLAYDVDGLIWDAGVMWRPSRRTALEAYVGRRYGTTSYWGTFSYTPNQRSALNIAVYDNIAGFGGQVNRALAELPEEFSAVRNPLTGDIGGCVATQEQGGCLSSVLGSVRSATFRARGVMATYGYKIGRLQTGIGAGYDRRRFIAARGTVLASANGVVDENFWLSTYLTGEINAQSSFSANLFANWFKPSVGRDVSAVGATAAYNRRLTKQLQATAAVGFDAVNEEAPFEDYWTASALLGVRYSF